MWSVGVVWTDKGKSSPGQWVTYIFEGSDVKNIDVFVLFYGFTLIDLHLLLRPSNNHNNCLTKRDCYPSANMCKYIQCMYLT